MPQKIPRVKERDPVSASHLNRLIDEMNRVQQMSGDQYISLHRNGSGVQFKFNAPALRLSFQVSQDTPQDQGYLTALPLAWTTNGNYTSDQDDKELKVYDEDNLISTTSPLHPTGGAFPNYGTTGPRLSSNWTKKGFRGVAYWEGNQGVWAIERVNHVARFINFSYAGPAGSSYTFGQPNTNLSVLQSWDGLDPTKTSFTPSGGGEPKTNQISLVDSPDNGYTIKSGNKGTAVWRDDLDNSLSWQYQVIDAPCNS
jgi:hypothetical protein